jgi:hypothetical protein
MPEIIIIDNGTGCRIFLGGYLMNRKREKE